MCNHDSKKTTAIDPEVIKSQQSLIKSCKGFFPGIIAAILLFINGESLNKSLQIALLSIFIYSAITGTKHLLFGFKNHLVCNLTSKKPTKTKATQINGAIEIMKSFQQNPDVFYCFQAQLAIGNSNHNSHSINSYDSMISDISNFDSELFIRASEKIESLKKLSDEFINLNKRKLILSDERRIKILEMIKDIGLDCFLNYPGLLNLTLKCIRSIKIETSPEVLIKLINLANNFLLNLILEESMRIECITTVHSQALSNVLKADTSLFPNEAEILRGDICKKTALDLGFQLKNVKIILKLLKKSSFSNSLKVRQASKHSLRELKTAFNNIKHGRLMLVLEDVSY